MSANFLGVMNEISPFRFWCQKVLPLVYDDSLSYYELLCRVVDYINKLITDEQQLVTAYEELESYVNTYFDSLDVEEKIIEALDRMAADGTLTSLIARYVDPKLAEQTQYNVTTRNLMNTNLESQNIYNQETRTSLTRMIESQNNEIAGIRAAVGSPLTAATVSAMIDRTKIYVYTGSESGYTHGNWYYWNGSAWTSGGVYNAATVATDTTLTVAGRPADAKATGARLDVCEIYGDLEEGQLNTILNNLFANYLTTDGELIYYENGNIYDNENYCYSAWMPVFKNHWYWTNANNAHIVFYDANRTFLKGYLKTIETPYRPYNSENAAFVRIAIPLAQKSSCVFGEVSSLMVANLYNTIEKDLISADVINAGYLLYYETGARSERTDYSTTDYLPVTPNTYYEYVGERSHICFWDGSHNFIAGYLVGVAQRFKFNTKSAVYVTVSLPDATIESAELGVLKPPTNNFAPYSADYIYRTFTIPGSNAVDGTTAQNTACLKLPTYYSPSGTPTKLCIICHGASGGISKNSGWTLSEDYNNIVNALLTAGFAVMDSNGYSDAAALGYNHWNCPRALAGYYKAWDYFTKAYNLDREVYLYGFSMGALTALTIAREKTIPVKAAFVCCPVVSLYQHCVVQNGGVTRDDFKTAWEVESYSADAVNGYDRYLDIVSVGGEGYVFDENTPLMIGYGRSDENVSLDRIVEYYSALRKANSGAVLKAYDGGHEISYGQSQSVITDVVRWFYRFGS